MSDSIICALIAVGGIVLGALINGYFDWIKFKRTHPTQEKNIVYDTIATTINYNTYVVEKPSDKDGSLLQYLPSKKE